MGFLKNINFFTVAAALLVFALVLRLSDISGIQSLKTPASVAEDTAPPEKFEPVAKTDAAPPPPVVDASAPDTRPHSVIP